MNLRRPIDPVAVTAVTATSALGTGTAPMLEAIRNSTCALRPNDFGNDPLPTWIGRVDGLDAPLPEHLANRDCRNNRLAWLGLQADGFLEAVRAARDRFGASRVAVIMGTSTSSIGATEEAYRHLDEHDDFSASEKARGTHSLHSLGQFVQEALGLDGPCSTVSTACSSSAKTFAAAERMLRLGVVDAAVVGGVDTLCGHTLFGFNALQLVSSAVCRPFDIDRAGINLGEAAGFALLQRKSDTEGCEFELAGYGESSDAHHMSAPHPEGRGAERALDDALRTAGIDTGDVDYLHLHGTGTLKNDEVEAALLTRRFDARTDASSTKGMTGHTLGAAGMLGAAFSLLALRTGWMAPTVNCLEPEPAWRSRLLLRPSRRDVRCAASSSFGFGGSNCVLVFRRAW